ncbi:MAG: tRNA pseudouridine(38-40) synthase TruA [Candidatus Eisenbacteria bacterium]|nr:tRNA pseudouridine(38-40) synthase TruA [Candidatus Eisenbacteria bacterium]
MLPGSGGSHEVPGTPARTRGRRRAPADGRDPGVHDRHLKLVVEYDGADFAGWQVQPGQRTVQGVLEEAFGDLSGRAVRVTGAGRTDAGVHALAMTAHVDLETDLEAASIRNAVNARLEDDVLLHDVSDAPPDFHARYSATARSYLYLMGRSRSPIWRGRRWFVRGPLDLDAMSAATEALAGEHDFSSFCLAGSEPEHHRCRVDAISIECEPRYGGMIVFHIRADRFLRGMVRSIVGTLVEVGRGRFAAGEMGDILDAMDRGRAGPTAPACGLYLERVDYE